MNCPNCGGKAKKQAHIKDGASAYKQWKCCSCRGLFHTVETVCPREDFLVRQNEKSRRNYRKRCMQRYQGATV